MTTPSQPDAATPQHTPKYRVIPVNDAFRILDSNGATVAETYLRGPEDKRIADAIAATLNDPGHAQLTADLAACRKALEDKWQPIETAPLDQSVDLWVRRFIIGKAGHVEVEEVGRVVDARWDTTSRYQERSGETPGKFIEGENPEWVHFVDHIDREAIESETAKATHWMPISDPPDARAYLAPREGK